MDLYIILFSIIAIIDTLAFFAIFNDNSFYILKEKIRIISVVLLLPFIGAFWELYRNRKIDKDLTYGSNTSALSSETKWYHFFNSDSSGEGGGAGGD